MNFFRKLFGLGPSEVSNKIKRTNNEPKSSKTETKIQFENPENHTILPYLVSAESKEIDLSNQLAQVFHEREGIYANILIVLTSLSHGNKPEIGTLRTESMQEEEYQSILELALKNIEDFMPDEFEFWNSDNDSFSFDILTAPISSYTSEKILSKKQMLQAHQMLKSKELIVSIGRKETLFICGRDNLSEKQLQHFVDLHFYVISSDQYNTEILSEDLFVVENGEIKSTFNIQQISDILTSNQI